KSGTVEENQSAKAKQLAQTESSFIKTLCRIGIVHGHGDLSNLIQKNRHLFSDEPLGTFPEYLQIGPRAKVIYLAPVIDGKFRIFVHHHSANRIFGLFHSQRPS